jgi:hypothetical protein
VAGLPLAQSEPETVADLALPQAQLLVVPHGKHAEHYEYYQR